MRTEIERVSFNRSLRETCERYLGLFPEESERLKRLISLTERPDIDLRSRATIPEGHICASGIIFSSTDRKILMLEHKALGILVVPGGHYDLEDRTPENTAIREAEEETGFKGLTIHPWHRSNGIPLDLDTHFIPARPIKGEVEHVHYEFRFVLATPCSDAIEINPVESIGYRWVDLKDVDPAWSIAPAVRKLSIIDNIYEP